MEPGITFIILVFCAITLWHVIKAKLDDGAFLGGFLVGLLANASLFLGVTIPYLIFWGIGWYITGEKFWLDGEVVAMGWKMLVGAAFLLAIMITITMLYTLACAPLFEIIDDRWGYDGSIDLDNSHNQPPPESDEDKMRMWYGG